MSNSGEGTKCVDEVVGRPEVLAEAEARLREATEIARHQRPQVSGWEIAKEIAAGLGRPLTALLALGVIACVTDIDKNPSPNPAAASASANPGSSGAAGAGGEPPDPDKWGKMEGALYGNPDFTLTTPATKPAFDQPGTQCHDTAQCEIDGQIYTIFPTYSTGDAYNLQFSVGSTQNPEAAMASPTADFIEGLEQYGQIYDIACYKDKIVFYNSEGGLKMATLVQESGGLKAIDIVELPFTSDEITILVDNGVPYLYYGSGGIGVARVPLSDLPNIDNWESVPSIEDSGSLPAEIIPPDPTTGEGLYFGEKNGIVYAAKTLAGLAASNAVVKELNGNPPAYFTGNVTATPVYNEAGQVVKVYVTFVRQQTEFSKRKLHYVVFSLAPKVDPPPDTDLVPDTNTPDAGSADKDTTSLEDLGLEVVEEGVIGDADNGDTGEPGDAELPWELQDDPEDPDIAEDVPEDVPVEDPDVPVEPPDDGAEPIDEGNPADPGATDLDKPPQDPGPQPTDTNPTTDPDTAKADVKADAEPLKLDTEEPDAKDPDAENPPTSKLFKFQTGPEYGNCTATIKLLDPQEAKKYDIQIEGTGTEEKPCVAEVQIEGSENVMIYMFWNDANGEVKQKCVIVDKSGAAKPFCEVLAVNNLFDVVESGEGTQGKVLGTITGSSASRWTIAYRQGMEELPDGTPQTVNYVEVRNNEEGTTVLMKLDDSVILTLTEAKVWYRLNAETGEKVPYFPTIPNPPEGAESLPIPWELQPETQHGDFATTQPPGSDPTSCAAGTSRRVRAATDEHPTEKPSNPGTFLGTFLILLSTIAGMIVGRRKGKKRA